MGHRGEKRKKFPSRLLDVKAQPNKELDLTNPEMMT